MRDDSHGLTRRNLLRLAAAGALGAAASACEATAHQAPHGQIAASPNASSQKGVRPARPLAPVTAWQRPAFRLHDLMPQAPANAVALTIDDGPHPKWTPMILEVLAHHRVAATFSLIGVRAAQFPELARRVVTAGHGVCNHSMHHPQPFSSLPPERIYREVADADRCLREVTGVAPRLFRAPGGAWSPVVFQTAAEHGMVPAGWDVDPRDWKRPGTRRIRQALLAARPGDILLCHDGGGDRAETIAALHEVIPLLQRRGLQFVALT